MLGGDILDLIGPIFAFFFTFLILLYAVSDNALFRLAIHVFIGVTAGYAAAVAIRDVLIPQLMNTEGMVWIITILWVGFLSAKISPQLAKLGNPASAMLLGTGAAVSIIGAVQGTLLPQIFGAYNIFSPEVLQLAGAGDTFGIIFEGSIVLVGTVATLLHFHFSARSLPNQIPQRSRLISWISKIGQVFIAITFGVVFAGVYSAALVALVERLDFIINFFVGFMQT